MLYLQAQISLKYCYLDFDMQGIVLHIDFNVRFSFPYSIILNDAFRRQHSCLIGINFSYVNGKIFRPNMVAIVANRLQEFLHFHNSTGLKVTVLFVRFCHNNMIY